MKGRQGFTLMELLVVLLIIGILSTVALRTIDATRDRSLFDQTTKEMNKLVQAIVGNPDLSYDGRRVDFGYYGDMEVLPTDLHDLVLNLSGSSAWHGPYFKLTSAGDTVSYLFDGWGHPYTLNPTLGTIQTTGGKYQMTVKITDSLRQLDTSNMIAGTITDRNDAAPGTQNQGLLSVKLYYNNKDAHGGDSVAPVIPEPSGYYEFNFLADSAKWRHVVPIGIHKLVAATATESLVRYVTVLPRSKTIVDFKFTSSFWGGLQKVGPTKPTPDGRGFLINVENHGTQDVTVNWLRFLATSESLYMREFRIGTDNKTLDPLIGPGGTVTFTAPVTIAPKDLVELSFSNFHVDSQGSDDSVVVTGDTLTFKFRFSDQSEITVTP